MPAPPGIHSDSPVPGYQPVLFVSVASSSLACLPHLYCACTVPQDLKTMHTPKMENAFNFSVGFYFEYARLNALEFIHHVSSHLF